MKHRMSRAIDAVELKISIAYSNILEDGKSLDQIIDEQPTVEPQMVRCKDCKHHGTNGYRLNCAVFCCTMPDDGFCSCGERREDG